MLPSLLLLRIPLPRRASLFKIIFKFGGKFRRVDVENKIKVRVNKVVMFNRDV